MMHRYPHEVVTKCFFVFLFPLPLPVPSLSPSVSFLDAKWGRKRAQWTPDPDENHLNKGLNVGVVPCLVRPAVGILLLSLVIRPDGRSCTLCSSVH
ncbi:hypothetical protein ASPFODRAFT_506397 [Aspergillus luchuensis CBS 106.47]|uniref:Secreted protein n=1 Tax=Aspergillus luchuensis (strain CBS 106.47) TaxID=1137211 RepID=A0A1M3TT37_ASPLC|nr:hypothetical protein ASPFODRAFT_506397 [Aspergillus luchuensis CBS 106.47]